MNDEWQPDDPAADWLDDQPELDEDEWREPEQWSGEEWEEWRPPMSTGRKLALAALGTAAVVLVLAGLGWVWLQRQIDPPGPPGDEVEVEIAIGSTTEDIGELLDDRGVITSATIWNYWTRLKDEGPFQAGIYLFQESSSFSEAVAVLDAGPRPVQSDRVTIPEGLTVAEIAVRLGDPTTGIERWDEAALRAAIESGAIRSRYQPVEVTSLEGLLFPDTYAVADDTDEATFIASLVSEMDARLDALDVEARAAALGRTPYEIVIIASLIEEEARVPGERGKISRVIHNRLEQGIPLGIDATNRYEAELAGRDREDIDFDSDSPYNTRRFQGLVPTPIAAPGQASLEAALAPEDGDWIFYVLADEQGNHFFTASSAEFQRAKQECIRLGLGCG